MMNTNEVKKGNIIPLQHKAKQNKTQKKGKESHNEISFVFESVIGKVKQKLLNEVKASIFMWNI